MPRILAATTLLLLLTLAGAGPAQAQGRGAGAADSGAAPGAVPWSGLSGAQRTALRPLRDQWSRLAADDQRKWLAIAQNFDRLSPDERATLQQRMSDWARLSPAQRARARLNFGETRRIPEDEKRARWEQYQALTPEQREQLARERPKPPAGAAPALRPAPPGQIVRPAPADDKAGTGGRGRRPINRNTLLPKPPRSDPGR